MDKLKEKSEDLFAKIINFFNKNKKLMIIFIILLLLPIVLLIFTKFSPTNLELKKLNSLSEEILISNKNFKSAINDKSINPELSKELLSKNIIELERIKNEVLSLEISKLKENKKLLINCIDLNISLSTSALDLYNNPKSEMLKNKIKDYNSKLNLFLKETDKLKKLGLTQITTTDTVSFFNFTENYFNTLYEMNMLSEIHGKIKRSFIASIMNINSKFSKINEDLKPAIDNIYETKRDTSTLLSNIEDKKNTLDEIKKDYFNLSIPEDAYEIKDSIATLINIYQIYIDDLYNNIISNNRDNLENSYDKFNDFKDLYNKFLTQLEEYKNK